MISRNLTMRVSLICILFAMLSTGCGGRTGEITGHITGAKSGQPLANTQIILCQLSSEISGCTMQSAPTTRSDTSGAFTLSDVSPGNYVLLYGMPDELVSSPEEWEGVVVGATTVVVDENGKFVQEGEGRFWEDGWESVGAQLTDAAGKTIYTDGYALSNSMGISMMVVNREREPIIVVQPRKTTEIEWQVLER